MIAQPRELFSEEKVNKKISEMAVNILYQNIGIRELNFITVLDGGRMLAEMLQNRIRIANKFVDINNYSIKLESYSGKESTGLVKIKKDLESSIEDKEIIIVEDIVDTGGTMNFLINYLKNQKKARSIKLASLVSKPDRRLPEYRNIKIDYLGFEVPDKFIVGCGMDYDGKFRELNYIGIID
jgi:hypoxanthine phosphoribosyltransferase